MYLHMHPKQFDQCIIYIYIHLYTSIYIYIHLYTSIYIYIHLYTSIYIYIYESMHQKHKFFTLKKNSIATCFVHFPSFENRSWFNQLNCSPQTLVQAHWPRKFTHFSPEVGILKTEPLADAEAQEILWSTSEKVSIDEDLGMVWRAMIFVWKWELVGVLVGCCFEINKCQSGWMDHDDIICMFYVFLIMYPTAVFVYSLHCMKPTFDCVGGDGYMLGSCVRCFDGSLLQASPTNHNINM